MNTEDNNIVDIDDADFEAEFFGTKEPEVKNEAPEEEVDENEGDPLAPDEDEDEEPDVEEEEDEDEEPEPQPKAKKNRAQERIEKLLERERLANERAERLERRLAEIEAKQEAKEEPKVDIREQLAADAPDPDAKDKDGNPLYELGEFDPKFIRDLTKYTIEQEQKAAQAKAEREKQEAMVAAAREEIREKWIDNLDAVEKEIPDLRENIRGLTEVFSDIEPTYGDYLASVIMASDFGPQVMNYLSQNIGEAQKIVASGPAAATLALGRLEARFINSSEPEEKRNSKRVSEAPEPPEDIERVRGRHGRFAVAPDTDNLEAFEREFYKP